MRSIIVEGLPETKRREREMILNLTQHNATPDQEAQFVVEPRMCKAEIQKLLIFDEIPTKEEIEANAVELDFAHRYENGYDYSDEEFYTLQEKQRKLIEKRDNLLLEDAANAF